MDITLIASSVRPHLWKECFDSLKSNTCKYEVVFSGNLKKDDVYQFTLDYPFLRYIQTEDIKPAQCYEVARRAANGQYIMWIADDAEFSYKLLDHVVERMAELPPNTLLSIRTNENNLHNNLDDHRFFDVFLDPDHTSPLMAPLGVISSEYLAKLGGFDRRYVCGQYENDVAMRVYADGGQVVKHETDIVSIDHIRKHGESTKFWSGYNHDRRILEDTWAVDGYQLVVHKKRQNIPGKGIPTNIEIMSENEVDTQLSKDEIRHFEKAVGWVREKTPFTRKVSKTPLLPFETYSDEDILIKSQSHKGEWV